MYELQTENYGVLIKNVREYCEYYNLPLKHLVEIMSDLKVVPMLRGKGFEFTASDAIRKRLTSDEWDVSNPIINAQSEVQDIDVLVTRKRDGRQIRIECKLAKNDSFKVGSSTTITENVGQADLFTFTEAAPHFSTVLKNSKSKNKNGSSKKSISSFNVKCMRSRTISDNSMAERMAVKYGVSKREILNHADNYRETDFDYVVTSMGNAFWVTENKNYIFKSKNSYIKSLGTLFPDHFGSIENENDFKQKTFNFLLIAKSSDLKISLNNRIECRRRKCENPSNCGFIPNYPLVLLPDVATGSSPWKIVTDTDLNELFRTYLDETS